MWGKWVQEQNKTQTTIACSEKQFYELLTCPGTEVTNLIYKVLIFATLRYMILVNAPPIHVHNPRNIKRKFGCVVVSEPETKEYKVVFEKHLLMENFDCLPYGYYIFISNKYK